MENLYRNGKWQMANGKWQIVCYTLHTKKMKPKVISKIKEFNKIRSKYPPSARIGFVPTMGFLHEGHLSLIKKAREENDILIVSIFVNPTQFGPKEDLSKYPRDLERDLKMLEKLSVDIVFTPTAQEMYPPDFTTFIEPTGPLVKEAEGASRPGHFRGVATIVLKLFNIIKPLHAYFGQKDAQQVAVIKHMIKDLNIPININIMPIIRESDGLAMSSRNSYLNPRERTAAPILYKALLAGKKALDSKPDTTPSSLIKAISNTLKTEPLVQQDYIQIRDPESFAELKKIQPPALFLIAAKVGPARLIDNFLLHPDHTWETGIIPNSINK